MNIELKISPELLEPVAAWHKREQSILRQSRAASSEHIALTEKCASLASEIAKLEDRATEDDAASALAGKREQLAAVERKLASYALNEDEDGAQKQRLSELRPLLVAAVGPFAESETMRVAETFSLFFRDRAAAKAAALQSDYISHLNRCAFSAWERVGAASAVATVGAVLLGTLPPVTTADGK